MASPSPARAAALKALVRVEEDQAYAPLALAGVLSRLSSKRDRALATELVYGTLRWQGRIDYYLRLFSHRPLEKLSAWSRGALRLMAYQALFMPSIPLPVACSEAVLLVKEREPWASGYVNGVCRAFSRGWRDVALPDAAEDPALHLAAFASHPEWLVRRWLAAWGFERTRAICEANNLPAPVTIRVNESMTSVASLASELEAIGVEVRPGRLSPSALRLEHAGAVERLPGFEAGHFQVQDESSQLVAWIVDPRPGEKIADLCAGPGGKSTHIAELLKIRAGVAKGSSVVSFELYPHKARLVEESAHRLGLDGIIETVVADARKAPSSWSGFHRVLVDAPCSGTGVLRRRPDLRWQRRPAELSALVELQRELLSAAARMVLPGGVLVYSTCSLEREENWENVEWFLASFPDFEPTPVDPFLPEPARSLLACGGAAVEIMPDSHETDGFFIFRAVRRGG